MNPTDWIAVVVLCVFVFVLGVIFGRWLERTR